MTLASSVNVPVAPPAFETVAHTRDCNPGGDIFGGWVLSQMDLVGGARAYTYAGSRVVTAGVTDVSFFKPLYPGDRLRFYTLIERTGRTSMAIRIDIWAARDDAAFQHRATGLYTFVSVDGQNRPQSLVHPDQQQGSAA